MKRTPLSVRDRFEERILEDGITYQGIRGAEWAEDRCYEFTHDEVVGIESAAESLHAMSIEALSYALDEGLLETLGIPTTYHPFIAESFHRQDPSLFGRFDLMVSDSGDLKLIEYNGDTPITFLESGFVQGRWRREVSPELGQLNRLDVDLAAAMRRIFRSTSSLDLLVMDDAEEELANAHYLRRIAMGAGLRSHLIPIRDTAWSEELQLFVDRRTDEPLENLCKLYPWEWLLTDLYPRTDLLAGLRLVEPLWKLPLSSKGLLALLWEIYPDHPLLLPTYLGQAPSLDSFVSKPLYGRQGANMTWVRDGEIVAETDGWYGDQKKAHQAYLESETFDGWRPTLGLWMIDGRATALGIRESREVFMNDECVCVPHRVV